MSDTKIFLGSNLQFLRKDIAKLTQSQLAKLWEIPRNTISSYETGYTEPGFKTLCKMSQYWKLTIDKLICTDLTIYNRRTIEKLQQEYEICKPIIKIENGPS